MPSCSLFVDMASNKVDLFELLRLNCQNLTELEDYIQQHGISPSNSDVQRRRDELFSDILVTDSHMHQLLACCCLTVEELRNFIKEHGLDETDPPVQARLSELQV